MDSPNNKCEMKAETCLDCVQILNWPDEDQENEWIPTHLEKQTFCFNFHLKTRCTLFRIAELPCIRSGVPDMRGRGLCFGSLWLVFVELGRVPGVRPAYGFIPSAGKAKNRETGLETSPYGKHYVLPRISVQQRSTGLAPPKLHAQRLQVVLCVALDLSPSQTPDEQTLLHHIDIPFKTVLSEMHVIKNIVKLKKMSLLNIFTYCRHIQNVMGRQCHASCTNGMDHTTSDRTFLKVQGQISSTGTRLGMKTVTRWRMVLGGEGRTENGIVMKPQSHTSLNFAKSSLESFLPHERHSQRAFSELLYPPFSFSWAAGEEHTN